ncbi:hypothetical protein SCORR_v1c05880 [Spiroplasma corruscae]|uniref:Uncharacterized protein n=1 Tax=Spiroplasma corruscae TaxID=216934 RepID=A0A222EPD3_9MOLU|nr:hypothetical protein [Spiroplasma corruscae]ASP28360.1 hypothetical protein SCORR_v1c05880 [Spiroplasma corruscae]
MLKFLIEISIIILVLKIIIRKKIIWIILLLLLILLIAFLSAVTLFINLPRSTDEVNDKEKEINILNNNEVSYK